MKKSALFHLHTRSGAHFVEHHGWEIPAWFSSVETEAEGVRNGVGLADASYRIKFDSKKPLESGWYRLGSHHYLTLGEPTVDAPAGTTDVTSVYANLILAGPRSKDVLAKLTSLNVSEKSLPNLCCGQTNLAHIHTIVLREDLNRLPAFHILISREYSESAWESIVHAGDEYHLRPFGLKALELLRA